MSLLNIPGLSASTYFPWTAMTEQLLGTRQLANAMPQGESLSGRLTNIASLTLHEGDAEAIWTVKMTSKSSQVAKSTTLIFLVLLSLLRPHLRGVGAA